MRQNQLLTSRNIKALKLSLFSLLTNVITAAQSQQVSETGADSTFRLDVSGPGKGKQPLHESLWSSADLTLP